MFDHCEWQRNRRRENPERFREYSRSYYLRHKDDPDWRRRRTLTFRRHYQLHKQKRIGTAREWHRSLRIAAIEHYGKHVPVVVSLRSSSFVFTTSTGVEIGTERSWAPFVISTVGSKRIITRMPSVHYVITVTNLLAITGIALIKVPWCGHHETPRLY